MLHEIETGSRFAAQQWAQDKLQTYTLSQNNSHGNNFIKPSFI